MGKGIPADHWENVANGGFQLVYGATVNLFLNRHGEYLGYGPEAAELVGVPEPETFMQLPWDKRVARMFCTLLPQPRGEGESRRLSDLRLPRQSPAHPRRVREGPRPAAAPRHRARDDVAEEGRRRQSGRRLFASPIAITSTSSKACARSTCGSSNIAAQMGLDMIQGDHEDAPGQLELNFNYDDALRTADRLTTYRQICAQVAREFNLIACFMCKPFMGVSANGCHHNISLWKGGKDEVQAARQRSQELPGHGAATYMYRQGGENTFMPDTKGDGRCRARSGSMCIGGIVKHLGGADRHRLLDGQFLPPPVGHRLLGAGLRRLGLPEPHHRRCASRRPAASSTAPSIRW